MLKCRLKSSQNTVAEMEITPEPDVMASATKQVDPPPEQVNLPITQQHEVLGGLEEAYGPTIWESAVSYPCHACLTI